MSKESHLQDLNSAQREAVLHMEGPLLILAGPGSGKTRVITNRIAYLLRQGIPASQILALTFTNKAAEEMKERLRKAAPRQDVWMGTFHRFCAQVLRVHAPLVGLRENYSIYDTEDSLRLLRETIEAERLDLTMTSPQAIAAGISSAKNKLLRSEQYRAGYGNPVGGLVQQLYPAYQRRLLAANAVDFDDLLLHVACMLQDNEELRRQFDQRYRYVLVDEYQDTNLAQYTIVRAISIDTPNLAVTGDPDQSIYGWRGANLNNILGFENDYENVRVIRLEQNYRSTARILRVADGLIAHNRRRKAKTLFTENAPGMPVRFVQYATARDEAESIAAQIAADIHKGRRRPRDFAIFYRINALTRQLERALADQGIPYQIIHGVEFYQRKEIKDVLAYLHLINNPQSDVAFLRIINTPARGIGKTTLQRLAAYAHQQSICLLDAARQSGLIPLLPKRSCLCLARFTALYDRLSVFAAQPLTELTQQVLAETGYCASLHESGLEEDEQRVENIEELLNDVAELDSQYDGDDRLECFLERVALVNDTDEWATTSDLVTLMTLHAAKGLEFPVAYIIGIEEGLLPHRRSRDDPEQLEEERRLLFVGVTRAKEELQLSMASHRMMRGNQDLSIPSLFLSELPREEMDWNAIGMAGDVFGHDDEDHGFDEYRQTPPDDDIEIHQAPADLEEDYSQAEASATSSLASAKLMTAAQLKGGDAPRQPLDPEAFTEGMLVTHPEYGTGTIMTLHGRKHKRQATVQFFGEEQARVFVVLHSRLCPVARQP